MSGGLPCPPFSRAGGQLGARDERNLFPAAIEIIDQLRPKAVMIENVRGILDAVFEDYRRHIKGTLHKLGYTTDWRLLNASDFGVPQLRPRVVFVAIKSQVADHFRWPERSRVKPPTVGESLYRQMSEKGWKGASVWRDGACEIAPTVVGGSKKHGGPDLGPTRSKKAWECLGVDGHGVANEPPEVDFVGMPRLTVPMVAKLQGFPSDWVFEGKKTNAYRQVGNAFPPPVACAVGAEIVACLSSVRLHVVAKP